MHLLFLNPLDKLLFYLQELLYKIHEVFWSHKIVLLSLGLQNCVQIQDNLMHLIQDLFD